MSTKLRIQGYTSLCRLTFSDDELYLISATNYDIGIERRVMDSTGHWGQYDTKGFDTLKRYKTLYLQDCPLFTIDMSFELTMSLFGSILTRLTTNRTGKIGCLLKDDANGILLSYIECYISDFSFSIEENGIAEGTLKLVVRSNSIDYSFCAGLNLEALSTTIPFNETLSTTSPFNPVNKLLPYYWWSLSSTNVFKDKDVIGFSMDWSQVLTPIFTCSESDINLAPSFRALSFARPAVLFNVNFFLGNNTVVNYDSYVNTQLKTNESLTGESVVVKYRGANIFSMTGVVVKEFRPKFDFKGKYLCDFKAEVYGVLVKHG